MHTTQAVTEEAYLRYMEGAALAWTPEERERLQPVLDALEPAIERLAWKPSKGMLLVKTGAEFEDGLPHTRANAIVLPEPVLHAPSSYLGYMLSHEVFHILSRDDPALRERLYGAIGFKPCSSMAIPPEIARLRVSNPDAPLHRHSIAVRYQGRDVEAMPYPRLESASVDPKLGFKSQIRPVWLLVERKGDACTAGEEADTKEMAGLFEQIGRNTRYLWHPEEILADNFAILAAGLVRGGVPNLPSPEIQEKLRGLLLK